jgi:hypothetical protein
MYPACRPLPANYQSNPTMAYIPCTCPNGGVKQTNDGYFNCQAVTPLPVCLQAVPGRMYPAYNVECRCPEGVTVTSSNGGYTSACNFTGTLCHSEQYRNERGECVDITRTCPDGRIIPALALCDSPVTSGTNIVTTTLTAFPTTVSQNGQATLTWSSSNATSCSLVNTIVTPGTGGDFPEIVPISGSRVVSPYSSKNYVLNCSGPTGTKNASASITVGGTTGENVVAATLTASPTTIEQNGQTTLTWNSTNATSCKLRSSVTGDLGALPTLSGSLTARAFASTATMTLSCTGTTGTKESSVVVTVQPGTTQGTAPTATLSANPSTISQNGQTTLTWTSANASSCRLRSSVTGDLGALPSASGSLTANGFTSTATMTITCLSASGVSASSSVVVTVQ